MTEENNVTADRAMPKVNERMGGKSWSRGFGYLILVAGMGASAWWLVDKAEAQKEQAAVVEEKRPIHTIKPNRDLSEFDKEEEEAKPEPEPEPEPKVVVKKVYIEKKPPAVNRFASSNTIKLGQMSTVAMQTAMNPATSASTGGTGDAGGRIIRKESSNTPGASVAKRMEDPDRRINRGTHISCNMESMIDTTLAGEAKCVLDHNVYSSNGNELLLNRGAVLLGAYNTDSVRQGVRRIDLIWDEIIDGDNTVSLNSRATGSLGQAGVAAKVDSHWKERFATAILISVIDVAVGEATNNASNTGEVIIAGGASAGSRLAEEVLRNSINIRPTLFSHQGDRIGVVLTGPIIVPRAS